MLKLFVFLTTVVLASSIFVPFAYAQTKVGFNTYLQPLQPDIDDTIIIKIELVNPTNFLIKLPKPSLRYELTYDGLGEPLTNLDRTNKISKNVEISSEDIIIEKRGKYEHTIFLEEYNNRENDDRIGEWTFNSQIMSWGFNSKIEFFDEEDNTWKNSILELETVSNPIKFSIEKEIVRPPSQSPSDFISDIKEWIGENKNALIIGIIVTTVGGIAVGLILRRIR